MKCNAVASQLSEYLDEILDRSEAAQISQHLNTCRRCRKEFEKLDLLRRKLGMLGQIDVPDYLKHMLQVRMETAAKNTLRARLQDALEYRWSKIRTTEGIWYWTRILGTVMTSFFFVMITSAMNPAYVTLHEEALDGGALRSAYRQQLPSTVLKDLGITSVGAQKRPLQPSNPMINDLYLLNFGQSAAGKGEDDTFSVVTKVDRSGAATIQNVLEYPADQTLLNNFNSMILSARCRPASQNGRAVDSHLVLTFSKISVYD